MVIVIDHRVFSSAAPTMEIADITRIVSLMKHFSLERQRVAHVSDRPKLFGDTGTVGRVSKYLNKLNIRNYTVVSHGIFRLLVDDSSVSAESIFDHIMTYACKYTCRSALFARVCADLSRVYTHLPDHIARRIQSAHNTLRHTSRDTRDTRDYAAYLNDVTLRRHIHGFFVFVCQLHVQHVISESLCIAQWNTMADQLIHTISSLHPTTIRDPPTALFTSLDAYCDCLRAMLKDRRVCAVLWTTAAGRTIVARLLHALQPFCAMTRPATFLSKSWYGLINLNHLMVKYTNAY